MTIMPIEFYRTAEPFGFLSNYAEAPIFVDGVAWPTTEHYYQAQKFADPAQREAMRAAPTPDAAKRRAWAWAAGLRADWNEVRDAVMLAALRAKFTEHADLRARLLATGDEHLVEHTTRDAYWGDGGDGSGRNRLGEILQQVRTELRQQAGTETNRLILEWLFAAGRIDLRRSPFLATDPPPPTRSISWDRIEGMLLGLAIGDALGNTSEGMTPDDRRRRYGVIRDYLPNRHAGGRTVGLPSDDSQLALWTVEQFNADRQLVPEHLARRFARQEIYEIGKTVREFLVNFKDRGLPWYESGVASAGNGALMRIAPLVIPYVRRPNPHLWVDTILAAAITHNDAASTASCVAFVAMLWELLGYEGVPAPEWWQERFVAVARELETGKAYRPRGGRFQGDAGPLWQFVERRVAEAYRADLTVQEACDAWHSAAYLLETAPSLLYILMRHGHDPAAAILAAVNDTYDNDTIAALVGAAVGALHGASALPAHWKASLLGRLGATDDGRLAALLDETRSLWFESGRPTTKHDSQPAGGAH